MISSDRQNMGTLDAMIRIALGSALVGAAAGRRLAGPLMWGMLAVGGWQIAQGVVRWDPIWEAAGIDTREGRRLRSNPYGNYPTYEEEVEAFDAQTKQRPALRRRLGRSAGAKLDD